MPRKLQRSRSPHSRKGKGKRGPSPIATQQPVAATAIKSVAPSKATAPSAATPSPKAPTIMPQYPYIASELRRISILSGIMLVILVVVVLVLS